MKRYSGLLLAAVAAMFLQGCLGSGGSSAPPPTNVSVKAQDSRVTVTWDMLPGVEYWIFKAIGSNITPQNCSTKYLCSTSVKVTSPATIWGLINDQQYSFTINARRDGGPGGAGSPAIQASPRRAGATWDSGSTLVTGTTDLRGVTHGGMYVAVGAGGASFSSADGKTWAALTNPLTGTTFNAVNYDARYAKYQSVGAGGAVIALTPSVSSVNWVAQTSNTTNDLYAIANTGAGYVVATGLNGTIITTNDGGTTWTSRTSGTTNALYGVTYGYDSTNLRYAFVAVGAAGTVRYSIDGIDWTTATTSNTGVDLRSVTYGLLAGKFVAVGASGTVITSTNGITWTPQTDGTPISTLSTATLNSVTYSTGGPYTVGGRFIAVNNSGDIFYSEYTSPFLWTKATVTPVTTSAIYSVTPGVLYDYSAVGAAGLNLYGD